MRARVCIYSFAFLHRCKSYPVNLLKPKCVRLTHRGKHKSTYWRLNLHENVPAFQSGCQTHFSLHWQNVTDSYSRMNKE